MVNMRENVDGQDISKHQLVQKENNETGLTSMLQLYIQIIHDAKLRYPRRKVLVQTTN